VVGYRLLVFVVLLGGVLLVVVEVVLVQFAKVVVVDITGVPSVDASVANHLVQTVDASRLMGANVIVTGLSAEIAQTLVTIGVDLSEMATVGDLQGGIEEAERLLGYKVLPLEELTPKA